MASTASPMSTFGVSSLAPRFGYPSTVEANIEAAKFAALNRDAAWANVTGSMPSIYSRLGGVSPLVNEMSANWMAGYPTIFGGNMALGGMPSTLERFGGYPWGSEFGRHYDNINHNLYSVSFRPSSSIEYQTLTNPIRILDREGRRMVWLCYDLKGYRPEEITVTLNKAERSVVVEAGHEAKEGKEHHVFRKFYRKFVLPETLAKIDLSKVELRSCLNVEGLLSIEIDLPKMTTEEIANSPTTWRLINEMPYYWSFGVGPQSHMYGPHVHGANVVCGLCYENVKPVNVKTA